MYPRYRRFQPLAVDSWLYNYSNIRIKYVYYLRQDKHASGADDYVPYRAEMAGSDTLSNEGYVGSFLALPPQSRLRNQGVGSVSCANVNEALHTSPQWRASGDGARSG